MGGSALPIGAGIGASLLGGSKGKKGAGNAQDSLMEFWERAQETYLDYIDQALTALEGGEAEASDEILKGLGLSKEQRLKFLDLANEQLDWVVDFGKEGKGVVKSGLKGFDKALGGADEFLAHYKELIFNPDAIYDTEVYKNVKSLAVEEWQNQYAATGVLSGNAQAALTDRIAGQAYDFLRGERQDTLAGVGAQQNQAGLQLGKAGLGMNQVGMGANAAGQQSSQTFQTGNALGDDTMRAYGSLAALTQAFNPANLLANTGGTLFNGLTNVGSQYTNLGLAGDLSGANALQGIGNALIGGGFKGKGGGGGTGVVPSNSYNPFGGYNPDRANNPLRQGINPYRGY